MDKPSNRDLLREIQDDLKRCLRDTSSIKVDLQIIKSKIEEKNLKEKKKEEKRQSDNSWFFGVGR